jgi:periplasmic protein TonB
MEKSTILTADVLDILFDGRNKEYGAYDLRKTYNKRLTVSISVMLSSILLLSMGFAFAGRKSKMPEDPFDRKDIVLATVEPPAQRIEPPPPPAAKPPAPPQDLDIKTVKNTAYDIVRDDQVPENERPPETTEMETARIGTFNNNGGQDDVGTVIAPPGDPNGTTGVTEIKRDDDDRDGPLMKVEIESEYPGGMSAWQRFLNRNLRYPQEAMDQNVQGFVMVMFIVDREGNVSNVEAVSGPEELRGEAIRVIRKSGKWTPAIQNGHPVKSYKRQPIGFRLNDE